MRMPALGNQFFGKLRDDGSFYVDKTEFIDRILSTGDEAIVFSRPRRFGKSLNMSMLDCYFNRSYAGNTWFDGLKVSELRPDDPLKNSVPVINLNLGNTKADTYGEFLRLFGKAAASAYRQHRYLLESEDLEPKHRRIFGKVYDEEADETDLLSCIYDLSLMLADRWDSSVMVLIDEYDRAPNDAGSEELRRAETSFLGKFLSFSLKSNECLWKGIMTGILPLADRSAFSGLNNVRVDDISSVGFSDMFGFTDSEMADILDYYGMTDKTDEARLWYDGYRFGDTDIYNPWSLLAFASSGREPQGYWTETASTGMLLDIVPKDRLREILYPVITGKDQEIELYRDISYGNLGDSPNDTLTLLAMLGYLKAARLEDGNYRVSVPNKEVGLSLARLLLGHDSGKTDMHMESLCTALVSADAGRVESELGFLFSRYTSVRIAGTEGAAQSFILGLMAYLNRDYRIEEDRENSDGYPDILMESLGHGNPHIVIEVKNGTGRESDACMHRMAESAVEQICTRDYAFGLQGRVLMYGVAVRRKSAFVCLRETVRE